MSLTVQQLLADAKRLSGRLREHDASADNVISNAQEVLKAVDAMRQYQEDIDNLNSIAHNRPRAQLVLGIQQENRHIRQLQHENKELRAALEEHQNAIELIMSKYRQHITCLVHSSKLDKNAINQQKTRLLQDRADKICEMASVMNESIQIDEERDAQEKELLSRLLTENKGLREMLEISSRNGSRTDPLIGPKVASRGCQTEELLNSHHSIPSNPIVADKAIELSDIVVDDAEVCNDLLSKEGNISKIDKVIIERKQESLSETKDMSTGTVNGSTSSPAVSYASPQMIVAANLPSSNSYVAMNQSLVSNSSVNPLSQCISNDGGSDESCSPSRPISAASDSSESSTESSTTSEEDEEQEIAFNTIKRRQTKINVISPKSASPTPNSDSSNSLTPNLSSTSNVAINETLGHCDETQAITNSNGDDTQKLNDQSAVNTSPTGDVNDNKENGVTSKSVKSPEITKLNGDKGDIVRTPNETAIDSVIKSDDKNSKKEHNNSKSASSMNVLVNSHDEQHNSLPGINLSARFKKANSKAKKSTIRKSDLRNNGCGSSDVDKKLSK